MKTILKHLPALLTVLLAVVCLLAVRSCQGARDDLAVAKSGLTPDTVFTLNDSTKALLADAQLTKAERAELGSLRAAAQQLGGRLEGAVTIHVARRDTLVYHDTLVTHDSAGTRTGLIHDSTFAGVIEGTVTAPPTGPLKMAYWVHRPEFNPKVGFVRVGDKLAAVVTWQGEQAQISTAFADFPAKPKRFGGFAEALVEPDGTYTAKLGGQMRAFWGTSAVVDYEQRFAGSSDNEPGRLKAGLRKEF